MADSDDGKPKEFFQARMLADVAKERVRTFRKALEVADKEYRQRQQSLQDICPHLDITECKWHTLDAGPGLDYTDIVVPTQRRCGDCGLLEKEEAPDRELFARDPDRTVSPEEFSKILQDALL